MSVVSAVTPLPSAAGSASEVKFAALGVHAPSARRHAGCGQWQKPFEYLPGRSSRSSVIVAPR